MDGYSLDHAMMTYTIDAQLYVEVEFETMLISRDDQSIDVC